MRANLTLVTSAKPDPRPSPGDRINVPHALSLRLELIGQNITRLGKRLRNTASVKGYADTMAEIEGYAVEALKLAKETT